MRLFIYLFSFGLFTIVFSFTLFQEEGDIPAQQTKHPCLEKGLNADLPGGFNDLFAGSGECTMCHDNITNDQDESISITNDWRSTMMANSSKDPFWKAKVSHETLVNPGHAEVLEDICTKCHAPVGHFNAHYNGQNSYSLEEMENDSLALDGVSCTVCHQITNESLGNFSGNMELGLEKTIWGPYNDPLTMPMFNHTGYTPAYGNHIKDSRLCGSCHTLLTNSVDLSGEATGTEFVEQAIYQEWQNSDYSVSGVSCQFCHVPEISDTVVISSLPPWFDEGRSPFGKHHLAGANVLMLKLLKENQEELGITAEVTHLDSTISRATRMLQEQSLNMTLEEIQRTADTIFVDVTLQNLTGHKFPTGYPSRRVFIELFAVKSINDTLFHSGKMDNDFNLIGEDAEYESHHSVIKDEQEVQIYEMVMGDVTMSPTTILERAYIHLKDNRIPPSGFNTQHSNYDTVQIVGSALQDENFNMENGNEGSGKDIVHFHIPIDGEAGNVSVTAIVFYQTVANKWLEHMFTFSSDEINSFNNFYNAADKTPVKVGEKSLVSTITTNTYQTAERLKFYPNPARNYTYCQYYDNLYEIRIYNLEGQLVKMVRLTDIELHRHKIKSPLPEEKGLYMIQLVFTDGIYFTQKIIVN